MNAWLTCDEGTKLRQRGKEQENPPKGAHNAAHIFVYSFFQSFFCFLSFIMFNSIPESLAKPIKKSDSINCEQQNARNMEEERKIQLSKHTTSYYIWIVQCRTLVVHFLRACVCVSLLSGLFCLLSLLFAMLIVHSNMCIEFLSGHLLFDGHFAISKMAGQKILISYINRMWLTSPATAKIGQKRQCQHHRRTHLT